MRSSQIRSRVSSAMGVLASFNLSTLVNAGSTRYRPPNSTQPASAYSDSYLGGSRHNSIGTSAITPPASSSSFNDPFTGPSRYVPGSTTTMSQPPVSTISIIPTVGLKHGCAKIVHMRCSRKLCRSSRRMSLLCKASSTNSTRLCAARS